MVFNMLLLKECSVTPVLETALKREGYFSMIEYFRLINLMNYGQINFSRVSVFSHETKRHIFLNKYSTYQEYSLKAN